MHTRFPVRPVLVLVPAAVALLLIVVMITMGRGDTGPAPLPPGTTPDYTRDVAPILARRCVGCHGASTALGGYNVRSHADVLQSGTNGPAVIPGDPNSPLLRLVRRETLPFAGPMPPDLSLTPEEIAILTRWVESGALP